MNVKHGDAGKDGVCLATPLWINKGEKKQWQLGGKEMRKSFKWQEHFHRSQSE